MTFIRVFCSVFKISTFAICIVKSSLIPAKSSSWVKTTSRWFDPRIATVSVIHGLCFATRVALAEQEAASIRGEFRDVSYLGGHRSFFCHFSFSLSSSNPSK